MNLTEQQVLDRIRQKVRIFPSQKAAAHHFGISEQYLCDILKGHRSLGTLPEKLGFEKVITYREEQAKP